MKFPEWSEEKLKALAEAESEALDATGGLLACSPELLVEMERDALKAENERLREALTIGAARYLRIAQIFPHQKIEQVVESWMKSAGEKRAALSDSIKAVSFDTAEKS